MGGYMNKERDIEKRWKLINRLFLSLAVALLVTVLLREYLLFRQNISFFNEYLYETSMAETKQEISNRIDQINSTKASIGDTIKDQLQKDIRVVDYFANEQVELLGESATLQEKREAYIDAIYEYDLSEDEYLFFVIDTFGVAYLSGTNKTLEGTNIADLQDSVTGDYFILSMIEMVESSDMNCGFVTYHWQKEPNGADLKKTSFVMLNEETGLIIGSGMYYDDYEEILKEDLLTSFEQYYSIDDYVYVIGYDGTIYYHPDPDFSTDDLLNIETTSGDDFHTSILTDLESSFETSVEYKFKFEEFDQLKTGYIQRIEDWNMYIGRSFVIEDLEMERSNYIASILPGFIIYNVSLIAVFGGFTLLIKLLITSNFNDITQLFNYKNDLIKEASFRDQLTNLYNRHKFEDIKDDSLLKAQSIGIIMLDANGLKLINDTYGHTVGDELLVRLAELLKRVFHDDLVFRWGGDEFIVVIKDLHKDDMLNAIKRYKKEENKIELKNFVVSAALGYAIGQLDEETIYDIIGRAEGMMYKEKTRESISVKRNMVDQLLQHLYDIDELEEYHAKHVAEYALILGRGLKLTSDQMRLLRLAALLHDVGKIGIDGNILMKSKPLTKDEYEAIKNHPERGYRILSSYTDLKQYADIVLSHHEWFDGNGYPEGIEGESIDELSRVIAIADAFEAMTHTRTYKMTKTYDEAIQELIMFKGIQFDPKMVDVFVKIMTKERFDKMQKVWQLNDEIE